MAKLSIIVPVYNASKYLERCLDSLVNQTIDDYEVILINDKSTDDSMTILERYQDKYPGKVKVIENSRNMGAGATRNRGLAVATGNLIGFVDSDDRVALDMYEKLSEALEETNSDMARANRKMLFHNINVAFLGRGSSFNTRMVIKPKEQIQYLSSELPFVMNKLFSRELLGDRLFPEDLRVEDYPFCIPLLYKADKVAVVPDVLYYYTVNPNGVTVTNMRKKPDLLDTFKGSDRIKKEIITPDTDSKVIDELNFIGIQNGLQRCRDVLYSTSISFDDKRELLSLLKSYITHKYGYWHDSPRFEETKKSFLYRQRIAMIDRLATNDYDYTSNEGIEAHIKSLTK